MDWWLTMSMQMYPCPHCPAKFDTLKSLEHHLGAMHDETLETHSYRCQTCDAEFVKQAEWLDHLHEKHDDAGAG